MLYVAGVNSQLPDQVVPFLNFSAYANLVVYPAVIAALFVFSFSFSLYVFRFFGETLVDGLRWLPESLRERLRIAPVILAIIFGVILTSTYASISYDVQMFFSVLVLSVAFSMFSTILMASGIEYMRMIPSENNPDHLVTEWVMPPIVPNLNRAILGLALIFSSCWLVAGFVALPINSVEIEALEIDGEDYGSVELILVLTDGYLIKGGTWCDECTWFLSKDGKVRVR